MQPSSTYRLQLTPAFGFREAASVVPYLAELGVSHVYCSPWLMSAPGSQHGYDVVDHSRVDDELGGPSGLAELLSACREHDLRIVLDIVPNHMSIASPVRCNPAWWSVLRDGEDSPYARWFDVDWSKGKVLVPVLGGPLSDVLGDIALHEQTLSYFEHELPLADGSLVPGDVVATLAGQHYRLADWHTAAEESTQRRFFDVSTLAGLRVEDPAVFDATHALILAQVGDGTVDGLRVDHPDGLADPQGYLARLADATGDAWVVAEKILEAGEHLPAAWRCAGTTGYDALNLITGLFVDPAGEQPLTSLWQSLTDDHRGYEQVVAHAKRQIEDEVLAAEVDRLVDLAKVPLDAAWQDVTRRGLREALVELLVAFGVYRAYVLADGTHDELAAEQVRRAVARAQEQLPRRTREIGLLGRLALGEFDGAQEFVVRFQQTCGPVMAKGVEDTTFYRYAPLLALNEVGGDPSTWGTPVERWHAECARLQRDWPGTMTTLSTHDTKRSEDVRARLTLLSQRPREWGACVTEWAALLPHRLDAATEQFVWQTLVGAWPLPVERALPYVLKAIREAKTHTSWTAPNADYEAQVEDYMRGLLSHDRLVEELEMFVASLAPAWVSTVLAQKLVQLTMPGVPDTYQGCELVDLSLVDPDNRRPVDYDLRRSLLAVPDGSLDAEKQRLVRTVLRLRRERPEWFGSYTPLDAAPGSLAFCRGNQVVTAVPLRGDAVGSFALPEGDWIDALPDLPVRLLVRPS